MFFSFWFASLTRNFLAETLLRYVFVAPNIDPLVRLEFFAILSPKCVCQGRVLSRTA